MFSNSYTVLHSTFYSKLLKNGHIICFDGIFQLEKCPSVQSTMYSCTVQYVVERIIGNIQYRLAYYTFKTPERWPAKIDVEMNLMV